MDDQELDAWLKSFIGEEKFPDFEEGIRLLKEAGKLRQARDTYKRFSPNPSIEVLAELDILFRALSRQAEELSKEPEHNG